MTTLIYNRFYLTCAHEAIHTATIPPVAAANIMLIAIIDGIAWNGSMWYSPGLKAEDATKLSIT